MCRVEARELGFGAPHEPALRVVLVERDVRSGGSAQAKAEELGRARPEDRYARDSGLVEDRARADDVFGVLSIAAKRLHERAERNAANGSLRGVEIIERGGDPSPPVVDPHFPWLVRRALSALDEERQHAVSISGSGHGSTRHRVVRDLLVVVWRPRIEHLEVVLDDEQRVTEREPPRLVAPSSCTWMTRDIGNVVTFMSGLL